MKFLNDSNLTVWPGFPAIPEPGREYFLGLDLGQAEDYTALAVLERRETVFQERDPVTWEPLRRVDHLVRFLARMPLGTSYTEVVDQIGRLLRSPRLSARVSLIVDATGVGRGVVDLIRSSRLGCEIVPVTITAGSHTSHERGMWNVPKRDLIGDLQLMLERDELGVSRTIEEAPALIKEMRAMKVRIGPTGQDQLGSWRESRHDDLVFAVALAAWWTRHPTPHPTWGKSRIV